MDGSAAAEAARLALILLDLIVFINKVLSRQPSFVCVFLRVLASLQVLLPFVRMEADGGVWRVWCGGSCWLLREFVRHNSQHRVNSPEMMMQKSKAKPAALKQVIMQ